MKYKQLQLDIPRCYQDKKGLPENKDIMEDKKNVFMGIGMWSKIHGLSQGVPIDIISMLIAADKLRNQLDAKQGRIYILLADSLALESSSDHPDVRQEAILEKAVQYNDIILDLCRQLNIQHVIIECSSSLIKDPLYLKIEGKTGTALLENGVYNKVGITEAFQTTSNYLLKQCSLVAYYVAIKGCALKISWCHENSLANSLEKNGCNPHWRDEYWFDSCYALMEQALGLIGFVYTHAGMHLAENQSQSSCVPYCAADPTKPRVLLGDTLDDILRKTPQLKSNYYLNKTVKKEMMALIEGLADYPVPAMQSRKNESNHSTILKDLATIASLVSYPLKAVDSQMSSSLAREIPVDLYCRFWSVVDTALAAVDDPHSRESNPLITPLNLAPTPLKGVD